MSSLLPPVGDPQRLERELALVPGRLREDAIQEAWVAHLDGRDPIQAVNTFTKREKRLEKRHVPIEQTEDGEPFVKERDGSIVPLPASQQNQSAVGTRRRNSLAKAG